MIILVVNCGSSSLKYQLLDMKNDEVYDLLAKGLVERIGMEAGCITHKAEGKEKYEKEMPRIIHAETGIGNHACPAQYVHYKIECRLTIFCFSGNANEAC